MSEKRYTSFEVILLAFLIAIFIMISILFILYLRVYLILKYCPSAFESDNMPLRSPTTTIPAMSMLLLRRKDDELLRVFIIMLIFLIGLLILAYYNPEPTDITLYCPKTNKTYEHLNYSDAKSVHAYHFYFHQENCKVVNK